MKHNLKKALSLFLSILLVIPSALSVFAFAEAPSAIVAEYDGQKTVPVLEIDRPTLPDGIISDLEYGYNEPLLHLTPGEGLWAEDLNGDAVTAGLPNYVDLYVAQDDGALYLGIKVNQAAAHKGKVYTLDTFLGFGDTITDGATTGFQLYPKSYTRGITTCIETIVTSLESSSGERLYSIDPAYEYPLPNWGSVSTEKDGSCTYIFEVELNLEDSVIASGKSWGKKPGAGYFSFDLGLFTETERTGTLHFGAESSGNVIPHVLNLAGGSADLKELKISNGGDLSPAFDPDITEYTVIVSPGELPQVAATASDSGAKIQVLGLDDANINLDHSIQVKVSPANGAPGKLYKVNVVRSFNYEVIPATPRSFADVLEQIATTPWGAADAVEIRLSGSVEDASGTLLGLETVFKSNGTKLPIVIDGDGSAVLDLTAEKIVSANDITFKDLTMPIGLKNMEFYAGAGNVVFENVDFGTGEGEGRARFYGDTYTKDVFQNWTKDTLKAAKVGGLLPTSITFRGTTSYTPKESSKLLMGAVGFDGTAFEGSCSISITPKNLDASFIVDGGTVSFAGARAGTAPVAEASLLMMGGEAEALSADGMTYAIGSSEAYKGNTYVTVDGSKITGKKGISAMTAATHEGNLYVSLSDTEVSKIQITDRSEIRGSVNLSVSDSVVKGDVTGGAATVSTFNTVIGSTLEGNFYGVNSGSARRIVNTLSGTTVNGDYVGGNFAGGIIRGVSNTVTNSTVNGDFTGANRSANLYGKLTNSISNTNVGGKLIAGNESGSVSEPIRNILLYTNAAGFFGGNLTGDVAGGITNTVSGGTFTDAFYAGCGEGSSNSITNTLTNATLTALTSMGHKNGDVNGDITNTLESSKFGTQNTENDFGGASAAGTVCGNVSNTLIGACTFNGYFGGTYTEGIVDAATNEITTPTCDILGQITNTLKADGAGNAPTFANRSGYGVSYFGGSRSGKVEGGIVNNISAGNFNSKYYGGSYGDALIPEDGKASIGLNQFGVSITNTITGGTFNASTNYYHSGGSISATCKGDIVTTISGGTFNKPFAFGTRLMDVSTYTGKYIGTISGGIFNDAVYGGNYGHSASQQSANPSASSQLTITGGTFNGNVYGGGKGKNAINGEANLIITGGTFNAGIYPGSETKTDNTAKLTIECAKAEGLIFNGVVGGRNNEKEAVEIIAVRNRKNILLGEAAQLNITKVYTTYLNRIPGLFTDENPNPSSTDYQIFEPVTGWTDGVEHIKYYHPASIEDDETTEDLENVDYTTFIRLMGSSDSFVKTSVALETPVGENTQLTTFTGKSTEGTLVQELSAYPTVPEEATIEDHGLTLDASKLTQAKIDAIDKATASMTTDELRQIALDYFVLQQSFSWTPNKTLLNYPTCAVNEIDHPDAWMCKTLDVGKIYGSIPYQSHGTGNLYRWMEYYDENTGIFYLTDAIAENGGYLFGDESTDVSGKKEYEDQRHPGLKYFFNQCSVASFWGWARVINSANFYWTADMTVRNGFIPVGLYTYGYNATDGKYYDMTEIARFGEQTANGSTVITNPDKYDTVNVISDYNNTHTSEKYDYAFYDIYAQMKPADCLVNSGHAMMVASVDPEAQTVRVCEQIEGWAIYESEGYTLSDVPYIRQGQAYKEYSFSQLMKTKYIAFTFAEFQDPTKANDPDVIDDADYLDFYNNTILKETVNITERYSPIVERLTAEGKTIAGISGAGIEETEMFVYYDKDHNGTISSDNAAEPSISTSLKKLTYAQLRYMVIGSNQAISDVFITVERPDGTVLKNNVVRLGTADVRVVQFNSNTCVNKDRVYATMADLSNGKNLITIEVQLGTGEKVTLFDHIVFSS